MRVYLPLAAVLAFSLLTVGCEGDLSLRMIHRDVDLMRSEVAAVARTGEGTRALVEERIRKVEERLGKSDRTLAGLEEKLRKLDSDLKSQSIKTVQERQERQAFLQSQAALSVKLDELTTGVRLAQGQTEEMGHGITGVNRRVDEFGRRLDQIGQRLNGSDRQISQAAGAAQEAAAVARQAAAASQQTAQQVTAALQQMAHQTNAAIEQVHATAQLALAEARKTTKEKPTAGPTGSSLTGTQPMAPVVNPVTAPPLVPPAPTATAPTQSVVPSPPAARTAEPSPRPIPAADPSVRTESAGELYRTALNDYAKGDYELAISGFRSQIEIYPDSSLLANARYWLGESYYSRKNYDQAVTEFALLVKQHPDHPKVASALLKQGYAHLELGDKSRGRTTLDHLLKKFPKSQEARWAKERLSRMK
jgi:tol-pal system protein YbgF